MYSEDDDDDSGDDGAFPDDQSRSRSRSAGDHDTSTGRDGSSSASEDDASGTGSGSGSEEEDDDDDDDDASTSVGTGDDHASRPDSNTSKGGLLAAPSASPVTSVATGGDSAWRVSLDEKRNEMERQSFSIFSHGWGAFLP